MLSESRLFFDIGVNPITALIFIITIFIFMSAMLFKKTAYAEYVYAFATIYFIYTISEKGRNDFLRLCFINKMYYQVRLFENIIVALPFLVYLLYEGKFLIVFVLTMVSAILAFIEFDGKFNFVIPTPFFKHPFEFTAGFRKSIFFYLLTIFLTLKGIEVNNPYLGSVSILFVYFACVSYYIEIEDKTHVWIFSARAKDFLLKKVKIALLYSTILSAPILITMLVYFPENSGTLIGFQFLGYGVLSTVVLLKYSAYPEQPGLLHGGILSLIIVYPLTILIAIPLFYRQSIKKLKSILG